MQYRNSVVLQQSVYKWTERLKNGRASVKHEEGAGPATEGNVACMACLSAKSIHSKGMKKTCDNGPSASKSKGMMLKNDVLVRSLYLL